MGTDSDQGRIGHEKSQKGLWESGGNLPCAYRRLESFTSSRILVNFCGNKFWRLGIDQDDRSGVLTTDFTDAYGFGNSRGGPQKAQKAKKQKMKQQIWLTTWGHRSSLLAEGHELKYTKQGHSLVSLSVD